MLQVAFCFSDFLEALSQSLWRGPQQRGCVFLPAHYLVCWLQLYGSWDFSIPFWGMAPMIFSQSRAQWGSILLPQSMAQWGRNFFQSRAQWRKVLLSALEQSSTRDENSLSLRARLNEKQRVLVPC